MPLAVDGIEQLHCIKMLGVLLQANLKKIPMYIIFCLSVLNRCIFFSVLAAQGHAS